VREKVEADNLVASRNM